MDPEEALSYAIMRYLEWVDEYQNVTVFWYQETKNLTPKTVSRPGQAGRVYDPGISISA